MTCLVRMRRKELGIEREKEGDPDRWQEECGCLVQVLRSPLLVGSFHKQWLYSEMNLAKNTVQDQISMINGVYSFCNDAVACVISSNTRISFFFGINMEEKNV